MNVRMIRPRVRPVYDWALSHSYDGSILYEVPCVFSLALTFRRSAVSQQTHTASTRQAHTHTRTLLSHGEEGATAKHLFPSFFSRLPRRTPMSMPPPSLFSPSCGTWFGLTYTRFNIRHKPPYRPTAYSSHPVTTR